VSIEPQAVPAPSVPPPIDRAMPSDAPARMSASDAARMLASLRKPKEPAAPVEAKPPPVEPQQESTVVEATEDAAPPATEATGETESVDPAEGPSIEPPRSWSKDARERWSKLDPDTQQYLLDRDRDDTSAVRKAQNDAAEARKAIEAERAQVEQARQQYENALPQLFQTLQAQQAGQFADVKTMADVERMAAEDWPRYLQWDVAQKKLAAVQQEFQAAHQRQSEEQRQKFSEFAKKQDSLLVEKVPDMADEKKAEALQKAARATLDHIGFNEQELARAWNTPGEFSLRDHRVQMLIIDATKWRDAQAKAKTVTAKPVPPVQRPGTSQDKAPAHAAEIATLNKQLDNASGVNAIRAAARLTAIQRAQAARR
jgi:hypothetical protein